MEVKTSVAALCERIEAFETIACISTEMAATCWSRMKDYIASVRGGNHLSYVTLHILAGDFLQDLIEAGYEDSDEFFLLDLAIDEVIAAERFATFHQGTEK